MPDPELLWVDIELLAPNPWNPNVMDPAMFEKEVASIHQFGFVDPITAREVGASGFQIIDGEHRWKAAREHSGSCRRDKKGRYVEHVGLRQVPVTNLGLVPDSVAKQLTIVLNETRGTYDPMRMGVLLTDLVTLEPLPELLDVLPFTREKFEELAELPKVDWSGASSRPSIPSKTTGERWVERVYRLPVDAAEKLDEAIREAREDDGTPDWRSLQTLAEHFLGS